MTSSAISTSADSIFGVNSLRTFETAVGAIAEAVFMQTAVNNNDSGLSTALAKEMVCERQRRAVCQVHRGNSDAMPDTSRCLGPIDKT